MRPRAQGCTHSIDQDTIVTDFLDEKRREISDRLAELKPLVEAGGEFLVRAEVQNRKQNDFWVLSPGLKAEMTIQLK